MKKLLLRYYPFITLISVLIIFFFIQSCKKEIINSPILKDQYGQKIETQKDIDAELKQYPIDTSSGYPNGINNTSIYGNNKKVESAVPGTGYVSVPDLNDYQSSSPPTAGPYNGVTYNSGPFKSSVNAINGAVITFKFIRTDGFSFPANSVLKIKSNNAGGAIVASVTLSSAATSVTLNIPPLTMLWNISGGGSPGNPNNTNTYVATWYNPASGYNFYTKPMKIVAVPSGWGASLYTFNNVSVNSNGYGGFWYTNDLTDANGYGQKYQCVHYIKKYYSIVKGNNNLGSGSADVYWNNYSTHGLTQRINNSSGIPQAGDIICFKSSNNDYHVGIVKGVVSTGILRVCEENVGQTLINGNYCSGYKDFPFTNNSNGYNVSGSPLNSTSGSTTWTTLGWVR